MPARASTFQLGIPCEYGRDTQYAFWLTTDDQKLLAAVYSMNCVAAMKRHKPTGRILVAIHDDHDPDEAWHWIYSELETAVNTIELDDLWHEAVKWLL